MITYNHEHYIREAIESVIMQKTDLKIELVIGEDYSTDKTRAICDKYAQMFPQLIRLLPSEKKMGVVPNFNRTLKSCTGKYTAICEGDDYWTDPYKLQKQVDFLEANPDFGLSHGECDSLDERTGEYIKRINNKYANKYIYSNNLDPFENILLSRYIIRTATVVVRSELLNKIYEENPFILQSGCFPMGDTPRWLLLSKISKFHYLDQTLAIYRKHDDSACRQDNPEKKYGFKVKQYELRMYFINKYNVNKNVINITRKNYSNSIMNYKLYNPKYVALYEYKRPNDIMGIIKRLINNRIARHFGRVLLLEMRESISKFTIVRQTKGIMSLIKRNHESHEPESEIY